MPKALKEKSGKDDDKAGKDEDKTPPATLASSLPLLRTLARPLWGSLITLIVLELLGAGLGLLTPVPLQVAVDTALSHKPAPAWLAPVLPAGDKLLPTLAVLALITAALSQAQNVASNVLTALVGQKVVRNLRVRLVDAALRLSLRRHIDRGVADSLYRVQSDAQTIEWFLIDGALPTLSAVTTLAATLLALMRLEPRLAIVAIAVAPPLLLATRAAKPALKAGAKDARQKESRALASFQEALGAISAVQAFGRENAETARFGALADDAVKAKVRNAWRDAALSATVQMLCAIGTATALLFALRAVDEGRLTLGQALLGLNYVGQIYGPLKTLGRKWASLQTQLAGLERAAALLDEPPAVIEKPDAIAIGRSIGALRLENVRFGYDERRPVLRGIDLEIAPGECLGIIGETGAGKSTLASLLLRLCDPDAGRVLLDDTDLRELRIDDVRRQCAVVFQETVLFSGTLAENIAVGRPEATDEEIQSAARAAQLDAALARFPDGLETRVGERGLALSGGERQRVGLARAFLRNAPILILDEPTSALDIDTEREVLDALNRLMDGRTTIVITHRHSALAHCDRIVRLTEGQLVLVETHPHYDRTSQDEGQPQPQVGLRR